MQSNTLVLKKPISCLVLVSLVFQLGQPAFAGSQGSLLQENRREAVQILGSLYERTQHQIDLENLESSEGDAPVELPVDAGPNFKSALDQFREHLAKEEVFGKIEEVLSFLKALNILTQPHLLKVETPHSKAGASATEPRPKLPTIQIPGSENSATSALLQEMIEKWKLGDAISQLKGVSYDDSLALSFLSTLFLNLFVMTGFFVFCSVEDSSAKSFCPQQPEVPQWLASPRMPSPLAVFAGVGSMVWVLFQSLAIHEASHFYKQFKTDRAEAEIKGKAQQISEYLEKLGEHLHLRFLPEIVESLVDARAFVRPAWNEHSTCPICLQFYTDFKQIRVTECGHKSHDSCLLGARLNFRREARKHGWPKSAFRCPICRETLESTASDDAAEEAEILAENESAGSIDEDLDQVLDVLAD